MKANNLLSKDEQVALSHLVSVLQWANSCDWTGFATMTYSDQRGLYGHASKGIAEIFKNAMNVDYGMGRGPNFGGNSSWYQDLIDYADELIEEKKLRK